jgi:hypothetical protein
MGEEVTHKEASRMDRQGSETSSIRVPGTATAWSGDTTGVREKCRRPTGVSVLSVLNMVGGALMIVAAVGVGSVTTDPGEAAAVGAVYAVLGLSSIAVSIGLWRLHNWARVVTVVLYGISVVTGLLSLVMGVPLGLLQAIIAGSIARYLCREEIASAFRRGRSD